MSNQNTLPNACPTGSPELPADQRAQWQADIARMRALQVEHAQHALKMGDTYNELKQRWGVQMPELAKEAGIPYRGPRLPGG
jgi:hypothetical protein